MFFGMVLASVAQFSCTGVRPHGANNGCRRNNSIAISDGHFHWILRISLHFSLYSSLCWTKLEQPCLEACKAKARHTRQLWHSTCFFLPCAGRIICASWSLETGAVVAGVNKSFKPLASSFFLRYFLEMSTLSQGSQLEKAYP